MDTPPPPPPSASPPPDRAPRDPRAVVWERWRRLLRARGEGRLPESEYRHAVTDLRRQLDGLPAWPASPAAPVVLDPPSTDEADAPAATGNARRRWGTVLAIALLAVAATVGVAFGVAHLLTRGADTTAAEAPTTSPPTAPAPPFLAQPPSRAPSNVLPGAAMLVSRSVARVTVTAAGASGPRTGTAVVVRSSGALLTTADLVADATSVRVRFADGSDDAATVVGSDPQSDLALLHVDAGGLPEAVLSPDDPAVGEQVVSVQVAAGQTLRRATVRGLDGHTTTAGGTAVTGLLQTDAPVPDDAAGSPLVDDRARVVGISLAPPDGATTTTGLAVPATTAARVVDALIAPGPGTAAPSNAFLGVTGTDVDPLYSDAAGLGVRQGALIVDVTPGSAAEQAGVAPGDVVVGVDGQPITGVDDLVAAVQSHRPGDRVQLAVVRDGDRQTLTVALGTR